MLLYYMLCCCLVWDQANVKGVTRRWNCVSVEFWHSVAGFEGEASWAALLDMTFPFWCDSAVDSVQLKHLRWIYCFCFCARPGMTSVHA